MTIRNLKRIGFAAAVTGGAAITLVCYGSEKQKVHASFLNNPSIQTQQPAPTLKWDWNWDRRGFTTDSNENIETMTGTTNEQDSSSASSKSRATRHLFFIRHGQYNLEGVGDEERYLTILGREQAGLTGQRLRSLALPYTKLVYSAMTRATETAQIILEQMDPIPTVEVCNLLREGSPIPPEPPVGNWKVKMKDFYMDGARIEAAFRKYFHRAPPEQKENSYEIFVCHANVIRYFVCRALQLPPEAWLRMSLHNGSITYLTIRPDGRVGLKQLGETGFMPADKLTFN